MRLNHGNFKVQRFQHFELIKKTTVPLVLLCPIFPYTVIVENGSLLNILLILQYFDLLQTLPVQAYGKS